LNDTLHTPPSAEHQAPRRNKLWIAVGVAVALAVAAFAAVYLIFFTDDSPPPLGLSTPTTAGAASAGQQGPATTTGGAAGPAALEGTWTVGANSVAGYRVREKLARLPAQSDAVGRTNAITGSFNVTRQGDEIMVAPGARFEVDVTKLASDESQRDNRIRSMGLESNRFPTATFVSASPIQLPATAASAPTKVDVVGDLTIHGVTKRVTLPVDAQFNGGRIEVAGSHTFPFSDFGMTPPNIGGFVTVDNAATLEFRLFFDRR
jgi:polyisoprenoid-binding protein YceI